MGIGIDFGTTRTVVASADRGNYPVVSFESDEGDMVEWFPSVVAERNAELRFGFDALATASDPSFSQVRSFKRLLSGSDATAFSRNFGVFRESQSGAKASYDAIFTRELALPRPGEPSVTVRRRYHAAQDVGHYRFFECAAFDGEGAPRGGLAPLTDVLFPFDASLRHGDVDRTRRAIRRIDGQGPLIEECYAVDAHGMVEVTITDLDSGFARTHALGT